MSQNATKSHNNDCECCGIGKQSLCMRDERMVFSLSASFPALRASHYPGKYIDRLTLDFGIDSIEPNFVISKLFGPVADAGWLPETLRWNYSQNRLLVSGLTLIRDHETT